MEVVGGDALCAHSVVGSAGLAVDSGLTGHDVTCSSVGSVAGGHGGGVETGVVGVEEVPASSVAGGAYRWVI